MSSEGCGCEGSSCGVSGSIAERGVSRYIAIRARISRHWVVDVS